MSNQTMTSIADAISALSTPCPQVSLTKHYKGITLNQQGYIKSINQNSATIQATESKTFYILSGMIHLRSDAFPGAISATIHPIDYAYGTFDLSDLSYGAWGDRKAERVQPKNPTYVAMHHYRKTYRAFVQDICIEGMGILANKNIDFDGRLRPGKKLSLEFQFAPEYSFNHLNATIIYRKNVDQQLIKLGIHLQPNMRQKTSLQAYINKRYDEIMDELEQGYLCMRDLYRGDIPYS
jgi:hypothetical protein